MAVCHTSLHMAIIGIAGVNNWGLARLSTGVNSFKTCSVKPLTWTEIPSLKRWNSFFCNSWLYIEYKLKCKIEDCFIRIVQGSLIEHLLTWVELSKIIYVIYIENGTGSLASFLPYIVCSTRLFWQPGFPYVTEKSHGDSCEQVHITWVIGQAFFPTFCRDSLSSTSDNFIIEPFSLRRGLGKHHKCA